MKKLFLFSISLALLLTACKETPILPIPSQFKSTVDLSSLEIGQRAYYLRYETTCDKLDKNFSYTGDTLILDIEMEDGNYVFQESVTTHSPMYISGEFPDPIRQKVTLENEMLLIPERFRSALFFFYGNDTIRLNPSHDVTLTQEGCVMNDPKGQFIGNDIGMVKKFEVGPLRIENKTGVSCVPGFWEMDAYLMYNSNQLYLSHTINKTDDTVTGWVMIE